MTILDRIKDLVIEKNITIAELERRADLGNGTIRRWNKTLPSADKLQCVSEVLGVNIDYLVTGNCELIYKGIVLDLEEEGLNNTQVDLVFNLIKQLSKKETANE